MHAVPFVIEKSSGGDHCYDIYSRLLNDRIIFLGDEIDSDVATSIVAQMLLLHQQDPGADVHLYVMSTGGEACPALAIYDTMQNISCPVATYCVGMAMSAAALLVCGGTKGKRFALPSSRIMIHQPWGVIEGQASDIEIETTEMKRTKSIYYEHLARHTGKSVSRITKDCDRNRYMSAQEATKYGLVDRILTGLPKPKK